LKPKSAFFGFVSALFLAGVAIGYVLAGHERLAPFKLLNIIGISYGLLGLIVLSELIARVETLQRFIVYWVAGVLLWAHSLVPLGAVIGAAVGWALPSSAVVAKFFGTFLVYSLLVLASLDAFVTYPQDKRLQAFALRTQVFGLILLITGAVAQLIAAIQDF